MEKKTGRNFWVVFALLIILAAIATIGNINEYMKMNKLNTEGKRILVPVDSVVDKGSKKEIFVRFSIDGKEFKLSKKVKSQVAKGDSVPVYYLPGNPSNNGIAEE